MDLEVLMLINGLAGKNAALDEAVDVLMMSYFRTLPVMFIFWYVWMLPQDRSQERRDGLIALLLLLVPTVLLARVLAEVLPFRLRPVHDSTILVNFPNGYDAKALDGWSSMPSDHAVVFFGIAMGLFLVRTKPGILAFLCAFFLTSLPRIYVGWHWPSDVLVGAVIGITAIGITFYPVRSLVTKSKLVPFFEARPSIGYPILFFATYEVTQMFKLLRRIAEGFTSV